MPELHLKQLGFTYSARGPFTKHCERIQIRSCFGNEAAYSDSKDLTKRIISDKCLKDRAYDITRNSSMVSSITRKSSMVYKFFDKETGSVVSVNEKVS